MDTCVSYNFLFLIFLVIVNWVICSFLGSSSTLGRRKDVKDVGHPHGKSDSYFVTENNSRTYGKVKQAEKSLVLL